MRKTSKTALLIAALVAAAYGLYYWREQAPYQAYERGDYASAEQLLLPRAEKGDGKAQWVLGMVYYFRADKDDRAAREWFEKAAKNGESNALLYLGEIYARGDRGVAKNLPLARELLEKGVQQGNSAAADLLFLYDSGGTFYQALMEQGDQTAADALYLHAPQWLEQATLLGLDKTDLLIYHTACAGYAEKHLDALLPYYENAAQAGSSRAHSRLGMLALAAGAGEKAYAHFTAALASAQENIDRDMAHYGLARLYEQGLGVVQDKQQARSHYQQASGRDCKRKRQAQYHLALLQAQGQGGEADLDAARDILQTLEAIPRDTPHTAAINVSSAEIAHLRSVITQAENTK